MQEDRGSARTFFDLLDPSQVSPLGGETRAVHHIIVPSLATLPSAAQMGAGVWVWIDDINEWRYSDGAAWQAISAGSHSAVTLAADADVLLGLTGQQLTLDTQTANRFLGGPTSGGAADPTFRALVNADLPALTIATPTIASGVATVAKRSLNILAAQSGTADSVDSFSGVGAGELFYVTPDSGDTITLAFSVDLITSDGGDIVMNKVFQDWVLFFHNGASAVELMRSPSLIYRLFRVGFAFIDQELVTGAVAWFPGASVAYDLNTLLHASDVRNASAVVTAGVAGSGTNTVLIEKTTTSPFTGSPTWSTAATLNLGTSKRVSAAFSASWNPTTEYLRAPCSAANATGPENVAGYIQAEAKPA